MNTIQIVALVLLIICVVTMFVLGIALYNLVRTFNNNYEDNETDRIKSRTDTTA